MGRGWRLRRDSCCSERRCSDRCGDRRSGSATSARREPEQPDRPQVTSAFWRRRSWSSASGVSWNSRPSISAISHRPSPSRQPRSPRPSSRPFGDRISTCSSSRRDTGVHALQPRERLERRLCARIDQCPTTRVAPRADPRRPRRRRRMSSSPHGVAADPGGARRRGPRPRASRGSSGSACTSAEHQCHDRVPAESLIAIGQSNCRTRMPSRGRRDACPSASPPPGRCRSGSPATPSSASAHGPTAIAVGP